MSTTYDVPCSIAEANKFLKHMLGSDSFVKQWWNSPNISFEGKTPIEQWSVKDGDKKVMRYILYSYKS